MNPNTININMSNKCIHGWGITKGTMIPFCLMS